MIDKAAKQILAATKQDFQAFVAKVDAFLEDPTSTASTEPEQRNLEENLSLLKNCCQRICNERRKNG